MLIVQRMLDMLGFHPARLAEEGQEDQPPRIEARQQRGEGADPPRDLAAVARREARLEPRVLRMEARTADRRQTTDPRPADPGYAKRGVVWVKGMSGSVVL